LKISLKEKNKEKEISCRCIWCCSAMCYSWCYIENILFEDSDDANTFCTFNPTQIFLYLKKKLLLTRCEARTNMLIIILLRNGYFFICLKYIEIIFFYFFNIDFLYPHIKIIHKHQKNINLN
jgi:hypothetical protein